MLRDDPYNGIILNREPKLHVNIFKGPDFDEPECHDMECTDVYDDHIQYSCSLPDDKWLEVRVFTGQQEDEPDEHPMLILFRKLHEYAEDDKMGLIPQDDRIRDFALWLKEQVDS